jgi:hypothetical protein
VKSSRLKLDEQFKQLINTATNIKEGIRQNFFPICNNFPARLQAYTTPKQTNNNQLATRAPLPKKLKLTLLPSNGNENTPDNKSAHYSKMSPITPKLSTSKTNITHSFQLNGKEKTDDTFWDTDLDDATLTDICSQSQIYFPLVVDTPPATSTPITTMPTINSCNRTSPTRQVCKVTNQSKTVDVPIKY